MEWARRQGAANSIGLKRVSEMVQEFRVVERQPLLQLDASKPEDDLIPFAACAQL
jgi:hypothetical protein